MAPHVIVVPTSASGHSIPFVQFARRLASGGVVTTLVSSDRHVGELEKSMGTLEPQLRLLGLRDQKVELSNEDWTALAREVPEERADLQRLMRELVTDVASPHSQKLRGVAPATAPVAILVDIFSAWALEIAEQLHIQSHLFYVSPATALSFDLQSARLFQEGRLPISCGTRDSVFMDIPGLSPIQALDLPSQYVNLPSSNLQGWMEAYYTRFGSAVVILINTFYDMEKPLLDVLRSEVIGSPDIQARSILEIGPLLPESYLNGSDTVIESDERDPCVGWLNKKAPQSVLYVSFGTGATHEVAQLQELARGLEASGCSFLWLVRAPNARGISAASGSPTPVTDLLPPGFEERMKDRGMCYSGWAPQMRILKHPAVGGFLSHCGWNSTLESVGAGVPILAWPIYAEQHLNRRLLVDSVKVAINLEGNPYSKEELESDVVRPRRFVSKEEIEKKVRSLMQDAEGKVVRQNMQSLREKSREAVALGGPSPRNFDSYVHLLRTNAPSTVPHSL